MLEKTRYKLNIILVSVLFLFTPNTVIFSSQFNWKSLVTDHFIVLYKPEYELYALDVIKGLEYIRPDIETLIGNTAYNVPVVIDDLGTIANGFTDHIFYNIHLFRYSPSFFLYNFSFIRNWLFYVGTHEYTHMLHLTTVSGIPKILKTIYGNIFYINFFVPEWIIEGITVYSESRFIPYMGRLNDGYFDSYIASCIKDHRFPSPLKAAYTPSEEFPYRTGIYIFGGEFFNYLAKIYGEDKFSLFFNKYGSSFPYLMLNNITKKTFGKRFDELWFDWQKYETEKYNTYVMDGEQVTKYGHEITSLRIWNNKLYFIRNYPVKTGAFRQFNFSQIIEKDINSSNEKIVVETTSFFSCPIKIRDSNLYYSVSELKPGYANITNSSYGFYSVIHQKNISTGKDKILFKDEIRCFDITENAKIIYSKDMKNRFGSDIYSYDPKTGKKELLLSSEYIVDDIVINKDTIFVSARKTWDNFNLYILKPDTKEFIPILKPTPYFQGTPAVYDNKLFFSANYDKKYFLYYYNPESDKIYKLVENGYAIYPAYNKTNNTLYYIGLNSYGNDIYCKQLIPEEFFLPEYPSAVIPEYQLSDIAIKKCGYSANLKTLTPKLHFPLILTDEHTSYAGFIFSGTDAIGHFPYYTTILYDFKYNKPNIDLILQPNIFLPLSVTINCNNFYNQFFKLDLMYPLVIRLSPGLSKLYTGLSITGYDGFSDCIIGPYLELGLKYPKTYFNYRLSSSFANYTEDTNSYSGYMSNIYLSQYINKSEFNLKLTNTNSSLYKYIRGYLEPISARIFYSIDFSFPISFIRKGSWSFPYFFQEDRCISIFSDIAVDNNSIYYSAGLELHLETKMLFYIPIDWGIRTSINKDGEQTISLFLGTGDIIPESIREKNHYLISKD